MNAAPVRAGNARIAVQGIAENRLLILTVTVRNVRTDPYDLGQVSIRVIDSEDREARSFIGGIPGESREREFGDGQLVQNQS